MDTLWIAAQILFGFVALIAGGEFLVRGGSALARALDISPLVIGLTVVAFGTSAPELGVSLQAAFTGAADVAVGNAVGSNIFNVLLILGLAALVTPLTISSQLVRIDVPLMIVASIVLWIFALDGTISRLEGCVLVVGLVSYILFCVRQSRRESKAVLDEFAHELPPVPKNARALLGQFLLIAAGLFLLWLGSKWLVAGSVTVAQRLGVSELIIGLTIVATGTSLPEVVTSVVASYRGERDIAVGNVVGSNLFNIMCVLGISSAVGPAGMAVSENALAFDIPVMVAVAVVCLPVFFTGYSIDRWEGALFLFYYAAYVTLLILSVTYIDLSYYLARILTFVVIPLTVLTISTSVYLSWRKQHTPD